MTEPHRTQLRLLAAGQIAMAVMLVPFAMFFSVLSAPIMIPALIWLAYLGVRLWRPNQRLRTLFRRTHLVFFPLSILLVSYGLFALHAAHRSAESGGGLLGAVGLLPITLGCLAGGLSGVSLYFSSKPERWNDESADTTSA